ncbi:MAG: CU044_2847 family protein [Nostoc sp. DedQUE12a]|nr:CU044_2847 family protein [Nostoc sp. DedQUE12a]
MITQGIEEDDDGIEYKDIRRDAIPRMQQARQMIRSYTIYALSAFKDFNTAEIEEVRLKFGIKLGGKAGISYITEGSAESNLEIEVKCKFPEKQKPDSQ